MRRYFTVLLLCLLAIPVGFSVSGCANKNSDFCNGAGFGYTKSQPVAINLQPQNTGISVAFGQIATGLSATATTCTGSSANIGTFTYGSTNRSIADVSPSGQICGGTWNINTPAVPDYTFCNPTDQTGIAYITASSHGFSSNQVAIYVHPPIASLSVNVPTNASGQPECLSQGQTTLLQATAYCTSTGPNPTGMCPSATVPTGQEVLMCSPATKDCRSEIGNVSYSPADSNIVTIDPATGIATAQAPGATLISGTVSSTAATAGYFFTCPPKTITLSVSGTGATSATVTPNNPIALTAKVTDTKGNTINGLTLNYVSTNPGSIGVNATGSVTSLFPSSSAITATCEPTACNPAPINVIGTLGTGAPVVSNTVQITSPGRTSNYIWAAAPNSPYFVPTDLTTGTTGNPIKLPYNPNSMVIDQLGTTLYFGSYRELMMYSATTNTLLREDPSVPGVVLAVSPNNNMVVINDRNRQVIYLYAPNTTSSSTSGTSGTPSSSSSSNAGTIISSFGGVAQAATFSPDGQTVYIVGNHVLYVYNTYTGWSVESLPAAQAGPSTGTCPPADATSFPTNPNTNPPNTLSNPNNSYNVFCSPGLAVTIPSAAVFLSGTLTAAYGDCPDTTVTPVVPYPESTVVSAETDHLAATTDGKHIIGATANPPELTDISVNVPIDACPTGTGPSGIPGQVTGNTFTPTPTINQLSLAQYGITNVDQVIAATNSQDVFVTYLSNLTSPPPGGALLPVYQPSAQPGLPGTLTAIKLSGGAIDPIAGIFSPDNTIFFVSTTGDDQLHLIDTSTLTDTRQIDPKLVDAQGNPVAPVFLAVAPRPTT